MDFSSLLLLLLFVWGVPSTYFRSKFRKIVYQTNDWKINIIPVFVKELKGLFFNLFPEDKIYIKTRNQYRIYLTVYLLLFISYINVK